MGLNAVFESVDFDEPEPRERRLFQRFAVALDASIDIDSRVWPCAICDLSLGGASVEPALVGAEDKRVQLMSPHFDFGPINGRIVAVTRGGCHVSFDLDAPTRDALTLFLVSQPDVGRQAAGDPGPEVRGGPDGSMV